MVDLYLDPLTHDLEIQNNTLRLTITEEESVRQKLSITLKTFKEEWFADIYFGIPYLETSFERGALSKSQVGILNFEIKKAIIGTEGIVGITSFNSDYNKGTREVNITFSAETISGVIVNETVTI